MKTSNAGIVEIAGHEGVCLSKYKDSVGVWTIGVGATKTEIPDLAKWPLSKKITVQEAFELLAKSIGRYENAINKNLTRAISQTQFDALVSWCYNVGVGYASKATVMKLINQGAQGIDLYNALLMFRNPPEIIGRRKKEALLLSKGTYSNGGKAILFPVSSKGFPMYGMGHNINVWEFISHTSGEAPPTPPSTLSRKEERQLETKPSKVLSAIEAFNNMFRGESSDD